MVFVNLFRKWICSISLKYLNGLIVLDSMLGCYLENLNFIVDVIVEE